MAKEDFKMEPWMKANFEKAANILAKSNKECECLFGGAENNRSIERQEKKKQFLKEYQAQWGYKDPNAIFDLEIIENMQGQLDKVRAKAAKEVLSETRMYFFVMYNLSGIQKGIQSIHSAVEYELLYGNTDKYKKWANTDKTVILLDAGGSNDMVDREIELENFNIPYASFCEPDLSFSISSIAFIVSEDVYNFDENEFVSSGELQFIEELCDANIPISNKEQTRIWDKYEKYKIFKWLKRFNLARN